MAARQPYDRTQGCGPADSVGPEYDDAEMNGAKTARKKRDSVAGKRRQNLTRETETTAPE